MRFSDADPMKLYRWIAHFGVSLIGVPRPGACDGTDGVLVVSHGMKRGAAPETVPNKEEE